MSQSCAPYSSFFKIFAMSSVFQSAPRGPNSLPSLNTLASQRCEQANMFARIGAAIVAVVNRIRLPSSSESGDECSIQDLLNLIRWMLLGLFRSKTSLEAEILALRHQLNVLRRKSPRRPV